MAVDDVELVVTTLELLELLELLIDVASLSIRTGATGVPLDTDP